MGHGLKRIGLALGLSTLAGGCFGAGNKFTAVVADVSGKCLLESSWIDVAGRYIYWEVQGSQVALRWHKSDLIRPKSAVGFKSDADSALLRAPLAFALNLSASNSARDSIWPEVTYRNAMRTKLGKPDLFAATVVHRVQESELWERNLTNGRDLFKRDLDAEHYVPTGYSVCDLEVKYLMKGAEAVFEKSFFGKVKFKSNQTVPLRTGRRSLAEEILIRQD